MADSESRGPRMTEDRTAAVRELERTLEIPRDRHRHRVEDYGNGLELSRGGKLRALVERYAVLELLKRIRDLATIRTCTVHCLSRSGGNAVSKRV